jgi:hypothetical protein
MESLIDFDVSADKRIRARSFSSGVNDITVVAFVGGKPRLLVVSESLTWTGGIEGDKPEPTTT